MPHHSDASNISAINFVSKLICFTLEELKTVKMVLSMEKWQGKVAIVTGASSGIGAAICKQLAENGLKVVGFARRKERVEELANNCSKGSIHAVKVDVTNEEEIKKGFEWVLKNIGPVNILINNAGVVVQTSLSNGETALWKKVFDTNVLGLCICTREAIQIMKKNKIDGHIININSVVGHEVIKSAGLNVYPASKFAVTALTETLRCELNEEGSKIKTTSISPGAVKTEIMPAETFEQMVHIEAEDVADSVIYVLSASENVQIKELTIKPVGEKF